MKWLTFLFILFAFVQTPVHAQRSSKDSVLSSTILALQYGGNWSGGDLKETYGFINHIGMLGGYKTNKNWFWGVNANYLFGSMVKLPNLFAGLVDSYGNITDQNGDVALVQVKVRGFQVNAEFGKVIPVFAPNKNSGLFIHGGIGYLLHHIRIETETQVVPSIETDYKRGYDRLASGLCLDQFVGYTFLSNNGLYNFFGGFYVNEGFTYNRRNVNFDQPDIPVSKSMRFDLQYGFKVGWYIPIYKRMPKDFYID